MSDAVNHPAHYTSHVSGTECIDFTKKMDFLLGNAFKYVWRHDKKNGVEDLKKALWYVNAYMETPRMNFLVKLKRLLDEDPPIYALDSINDMMLLNLWHGWKYDRRDLLAHVALGLEKVIAFREAA